MDKQQGQVEAILACGTWPVWCFMEEELPKVSNSATEMMAFLLVSIRD